MQGVSTSALLVCRKRNWFYIPLSLVAADRHGSGVMHDVLDSTDGELKLSPATLYGSLGELAEQGWLRELESAPADGDDADIRNPEPTISVQHVSHPILVRGELKK